jgi:hypothetical protein
MAVFNTHTEAIFSDAGLELSEADKTFIREADNAAPIAAVEAMSLMYSAKMNEKALTNHAAALVRSAEASEKYSAALVRSADASEKHAANLKRATWALVVATVLVACVAIGQIAAILYAASTTTALK